MKIKTKKLSPEEEDKEEIKEVFKPKKNKIFLKSPFKTKIPRKCNERLSAVKKFSEEEIYFYKLKRISKEEFFKTLRGRKISYEKEAN